MTVVVNEYALGQADFPELSSLLHLPTGKLKGLGHPILGNFNTDHIVIIN